MLLRDSGILGCVTPDATTCFREIRGIFSVGVGPGNCRLWYLGFIRNYCWGRMVEASFQKLSGSFSKILGSDQMRSFPLEAFWGKVFRVPLMSRALLAHFRSKYLRLVAARPKLRLRPRPRCLKTQVVTHALLRSGWLDKTLVGLGQNWAASLSLNRHCLFNLGSRRATTQTHSLGLC